MKLRLSWVPVALLAALALSWCDPPRAQAQLFQGKQITIIVGVDAGSAYDAYARLLARHMGKHLPGAPGIIVQNMPGAGSMTAAQHLANIAAKDGTVFGMLFPGALVEPLTGERHRYRYDPVKFDYLGTADSGTRMCFARADTGIKTIEDMRRRKAITAATAAGSSTADYAWFMNALAGTKFEVVTGYKGPGDVLMALERGEAEAVCALDSATVRSMRPDWVATGKINLLVQAGLDINLAVKAPPLWDFVEGENRQVAELIVSQQVFGRPFMAPPGTDPQALRLLRAAFMESMRDPALLAEANKMQLDINPKSGEEIGALVAKIYAAPPRLIERMKSALRP